MAGIRRRKLCLRGGRGPVEMGMRMLFVKKNFRMIVSKVPFDSRKTTFSDLSWRSENKKKKKKIDDDDEKISRKFLFIRFLEVP